MSEEKTIFQVQDAYEKKFGHPLPLKMFMGVPKDKLMEKMETAIKANKPIDVQYKTGRVY